METTVTTTDRDQNDVNSPDFDESGKNTRRAIGSATQALAIARRLETDDQGRDIKRARVLAAFNGDPPYDEAEMLSAAQAYRFNVSFGHMEGVIGRAIVPYNELVNDTQYMANIDADLDERKRNIVRDELADIMKSWGKWPKLTSRLIQDLVLNGYNGLAFLTDYDPFPIFIPQKWAYVHEMTMNDVEDLEVIAIKKPYLIHELYEKIEDEEVAAKAGWNIDNVRKAIEDAQPARVFDRGPQSGGWTAIQEAIRGGALFSSLVGGKQINVFHVLAAEITGKVSHWIVLNNRANDVVDAGAGNDVPGVELFKRLDRWECMEDVLVYFDLEAGDGAWHGSRGLGRRTFNTHASIDKLRCATLDQAFQAGLVMLQTGDQAAQEDFTMAVMGPFCVIPAGVTVQAQSVPAVAGTLFQVDALLTATSEQRVGDVAPNGQDTLASQDKTATQATIDNGNAQAIKKGNLQRFLDPISKTMSIIVKRLLIENSPDPYAQSFQSKLIAKGLNAEDFKKIRGAQSTGRIDTVLGTDKQTSTTLLEAYRGDPDIDQITLKRNHITAWSGTRDAEALLITDQDQTKKIEAIRQQKEEIGTILTGIVPDVSPRDNHILHAQVAMAWLADQIQALTSGKPSAQVHELEEVGNHANQHIQFILQNKMQKSIGDQMMAELKKMSQAVAHAKQQAQAQSQVPQTQPPQVPNEAVSTPQ